MQGKWKVLDLKSPNYLLDANCNRIFFVYPLMLLASLVIDSDTSVQPFIGHQSSYNIT